MVASQPELTQPREFLVAVESDILWLAIKFGMALVIYDVLLLRLHVHYPQ
jgi:hypothetical protein